MEALLAIPLILMLRGEIHLREAHDLARGPEVSDISADPDLSPLLRFVVELAEPILSAADPGQLRAEITRLGLSERIHELELMGLRSPELESMLKADLASLERIFRQILGETPLGRECARLYVQRVRFAGQVIARLQEEEYSLENERSPADVVADFTTPAPVREVIQQIFASEVALLALMAPEVSPERWELLPWQRETLLRAIQEGSLAHLKILALAPGIEIPAHILPEGRLDLAALDREHHRRRRLEKSLVFAPVEREAVSLAGEVREVVGDRVKVHFEEYGEILCEAQPDLIAELRGKSQITISGVIEKLFGRGEIHRLIIESWQAQPRTNFNRGLDELLELLGDDMESFDPEAFLKELRG